MDLGIKNKYALIGGGSKGLGKASAISLAKEGVNIAICARNEEMLHNAVNEIKSKTKVDVIPIAADLSDINNIKEKIVDKVLQEFGSIDILLTNSGGPKPGVFSEFSSDDWDISYHMVLKYVVELYKHIIPIMKNNKWGRIINIASLSVKEPAESLIMSNVFRSGVVSLSKTISKDLIKHNVTINNLCPGAFRTDRAVFLMQQEAKKTGKTLEDIEIKAVKNLTYGKFQDPSELGDLVSFFSSEQARGITGTTIQIDGGLSSGLF